MKYTIEFELPNNETVLKEIETAQVYWAIWGYSGFAKVKPSVQPKRKTGKWNFIGDQMFECTECSVCYTQNQFHQMMVRITDPEFPNFCPNCGAKMEVDNATD